MRRPSVLLARSLAVIATLPGSVVSQAGLHLDHVPIAVRDLPSAADQFRRLGFTIKPGRPHQGGIENASIKFEDGSYIELITAHNGRGALAREYEDFLKAREGAPYVFLRDTEGAFSGRVRRAGGRRTETGAFAFTELPALWRAPHLQLIQYLAPAHDPAGIYQHANGARRVVAVWMVVDRADDPVVRELGAVPVRVNAFAFDDRAGAVAGLADGTCLMLRSRGVRDGTAPPGLAILVEVDSVAHVTRADGAPRPAPRGSAIWFPPDQVHGVWLGFVERAAWLAGASCVPPPHTLGR
jgi:glyoxalase-like protein